MGFIKNALGMIGDAATGGIASGVGSFVSGIIGGKGLSKKDQMEIMNKQHGYELENMDYQAKLNEEMAQRNQQRQNEYFGMTAEYNSAKNQKQRLKDAGLNPALMYGTLIVTGKWWSRYRKYRRSKRKLRRISMKKQEKP